MNMKKESLCIIILSFSLLIVPSEVFAHPGRTDSNGCHQCKTNCESWGLTTGEYHCHNGNAYTNSRGQTFNSDGTEVITSPKEVTPAEGENVYSTTQDITPIIKEEVKSEDNTLKSVTIDDCNIEVAEKMEYKTFNKKVEIVVETNDVKAKSNIQNKTLQIGRNNIIITVTAENGATKDYNLQVVREKLSSNTGIKIVVDKEEIKFSNERATVHVSSGTKKLNYKYTLEDKNAKVKIDGVSELKFGDNVVTFKVVAQDGTEKQYKLTVHKDTVVEEVLSMILGLGIIGGIGYGIYYWIHCNNLKKKMIRT